MSGVARRAAWVAAALAAAPAAAQEGSVAVGLGRVADAAGGTRDGLSIAPALEWRSPRALLRLSGVATLSAAGASGTGGLEGEAEALRLGAGWVRLSAGGALAAQEGYRAASLRLAPRLGASGAAWQLAAGPELRVGGTRVGGACAGCGGLLGGPSLGEETSWRSAGGLGAVAAAGAGPLRVRGEWTSLGSGDERWADWTAGVAAGSGRFTAVARVGVRTGGSEERWWAAGAEAAVGGGLRLTGELGAAPSDPVTGRGAARYASVGARVEWGAARPRIAPLGPPRRPDGRILVAVRARPGARVELLGDWTEWRPVAVAEAAPGHYQALVRLEPGVHRFALRVDGEWRVPEGYETEPDAFGGRHALLRVADRTER